MLFSKVNFWSSFNLEFLFFEELISHLFDVFDELFRITFSLLVFTFTETTLFLLLDLMLFLVVKFNLSLLCFLMHYSFILFYYNHIFLEMLKILRGNDISEIV